MAIDYSDETMLAALAEITGGVEDIDDPDGVEDVYDVELDIDQMLLSIEQRIKNQIADMALGPIKPRFGHGAPVTIGFDTEYLTDEEAQEHRVLSYQFHLIGPQGEHPRIFYPKSGERKDRLSLEKMLATTIQEATETGAIDDFPKQITLCGFFLRLDLGTLGDFEKFKRRLSNIGGKLGTLKHAVRFEKTLSSIENLPLGQTYITRDDDAFPRIMSVSFLDVGSHAPEGSNLASIGQALGLPKLKLPDGYRIERMDELLAGDKKAFEAYALRDAEIAGKYFIKLQQLAKRVSNAYSGDRDQ